MVNRILSEREIVKRQFLFLDHNFHKSKKINYTLGYKENNNVIGYSSPRVNFKSYIEVFTDMVNTGKFYLSFIDGSVVNMEYLFKDDEIYKHTLSFYPSYYNELGCSGSETLERYGVEEENDLKDLKVLLSNYIRVDFDEIGYEEHFHSLVHMHASIFKDSIRLPVESYILPLEFVCFVLKYIYKEKDEYLEQWYSELKSYKNSFSPRTLLTESELKRFRLHLR